MHLKFPAGFTTKQHSDTSLSGIYLFWLVYVANKQWTKVTGYAHQACLYFLQKMLGVCINDVLLPGVAVILSTPSLLLVNPEGDCTIYRETAYLLSPCFLSHCFKYCSTGKHTQSHSKSYKQGCCLVSYPQVSNETRFISVREEAW